MARKKHLERWRLNLEGDSRGAVRFGTNSCGNVSYYPSQSLIKSFRICHLGVIMIGFSLWKFVLPAFNAKMQWNSHKTGATATSMLISVVIVIVAASSADLSLKETYWLWHSCEMRTGWKLLSVGLWKDGWDRFFRFWNLSEPAAIQGFLTVSQLRQHFTPSLHSLLPIALLIRSSKRHPPIQLVTLASSTLPSPSPQSLVPNSRVWEPPVSHLSSSLCSTAHQAGPGWASRTSALGSCRPPPSKQPGVQLLRPRFLGAACLIASNPRTIGQISILLCPHAVSRISNFLAGLLLFHSSECRPASFPRFPPK